MSRKPPQPDEDNIFDDAWEHVVGGLNWLQSAILGEFADKRPLSAVVADMLISFLPGVVIVTSARDAVAVILRLANHPEKRDDPMEWVLLSACLIVIALPIAMAGGGAVVAGVGAGIGGIVGSELGAALRAVMLMLIKEAAKLVELIRFLQKFLIGDIFKFLRAIEFVKYEKMLMQTMNKIIGSLLNIVKSLRSHLEDLRYFDSVKATIVKLSEWEGKFYKVQQDAIKQIPKALAELDVRLAKLLAETAPKETHTVATGVRVEKTKNALPAKQRVRDTPGKILVKGETSTSTGSSIAKKKTAPATPPRSKAKSLPTPPLKEKPDPLTPIDDGVNTKKLTVADAAVADRERITQLSREGKIAEARDILQPHVNAAKAAKTPAEKQAAMEAIIQRLDVTSDKQKMFWSGNKSLASKIATDKGKTILELTPGGKVIDEWDDLNKIFS